jgi:hypothetical protein
MSQFLTRLRMEYAETDNGLWILTDPLEYASDIAGRIITVPAGFPTDLASTPRIPVIYELLGNVAVHAAVLHDYLYTSGRESRALADAVMREACAVTGVPWWRRWGLWIGVRIGGGRYYTATPAGSPVNP